MNLSNLIEDLRATSAYPGRGEVQVERVKRVINYALRRMWADMPEVLLREEYRFKLEPPLSVETISIDTQDRRVFTVNVTPSSPPQLNTSGILRGRWLEVTRGGEKHMRRIRDVYLEELQEESFLHIVIDVPWDNNTDTELAYRILTYQYPYPTDVKDILAVYVDPLNNSEPLVEAKLKAELDYKRWVEGWLQEGQPLAYSRGDFYQEPAPHEKPTIGVGDPELAPDRWGYDDSGVERTAVTAPAYGEAGTFQYCYCLVWGRWPWSSLSVGDRGDGHSSAMQGPMDPFYMSAPSQPSDEVTTTWGAGKITIGSKDVDYQWGYGPNNLLKSYHHWGAEKWWFRRRVASQGPAAGNNAGYQETADGVWYLWRITEGHVTLIEDKGQYDPVDRRCRLERIHGQQHLMFDKLPSSEKDVVMMVVKRPPELAHDQDYVRVPPECENALMSLAHAFLVGRREGDPNTESHYWAAYQAELNRLRNEYALPGFTNFSFGDGLGAGGFRFAPLPDISEVS